MSKFVIEVTTKYRSGDQEDNTSLVVDSSNDVLSYLVKQKVFTKHLTAAIAAINDELSDLAIAALVHGGK